MFYVRPVFVISLHVMVYGFYRVRMQDRSSYAVRRKTALLTILLRIVLAHASPTSLNHTLCLHAFLLLFFRLYAHLVMASSLEGSYIHTY